jgi:hypothetical protein
MQAQQQLRISAAPLTAAIVIFATLVIGGFGGYAVGAALRSSAGNALTPQQAAPVPAAQPAQASNLTVDEGRICTADLKICLEAQNTATGPSTQQVPAPLPMFQEGRTCTDDFRLCREPQNSYD